jgi:hypothetical protein
MIGQNIMQQEIEQDYQPIWDRDIDPIVQKSIDRVLDFMILRGIMPHIEVSGNILDSAVKIAEEFPALLPEHLHKDGKKIVDCLLHWLADYADETNATHMNLTLRLTRNGVEA